MMHSAAIPTVPERETHIGRQVNSPRCDTIQAADAISEHQKVEQRTEEQLGEWRRPLGPVNGRILP